MENKPVRIAQVIGNMVGGGVEAVVMNYYRNIDRTKVQFDFIVYNTSTHVPQKEIEEMGGRVFFVPHYKRLHTHQKALLKIFKENKYDIVHSHINTLSVFSLKIAKKAGVKIRIAHSHSTSNKKEWKRNIIKNVLRPYSKKYATHYFACSELAGRWLFGDKTYDQGKVTIINNAIDLERFKFNEDIRNAIRPQLGINDKICLGHIGRFTVQKNQSFLIDIFNEFQKIRSNSILLILGDGPLRNELEQRVKDYNLTDKVIFGGVQEHPEQYYQAMDCFLLPSLYEGLGMVLVEAQACGLHCFASTEVPNVVNVTNNVDFISLRERAEYWAKVIDKCDPINNRISMYEKLKFSNYDIQSEANKLLGYYEEIVSKIKKY